MEFFVLGSLLVASTIVQIFFVRHFLIQTNKKILFLIQKVNRIETLTRTVGNTLNMPVGKVKMHSRLTPSDQAGDANGISDDDQDFIEFSEYNPLTLPNDIKFEVEGGDTSIPPGYSEKVN